MQKKANRTYYRWIAALLLLLIVISCMQQHTEWVELFYSRSFYPVFSYLPKMLFSWIPFSVGDLFYVLLLVYLLFLLIALIRSGLQRNFSLLYRRCLQLVIVLLSLYVYFHISWGMNYYRQPLVEQYHLNIKDISREDHLKVLDKYIRIANEIRAQLNLKAQQKSAVQSDVAHLMRTDGLFAPMLSKTQVQSKSPISSHIISYFTVTGYFNPFTQEVQVNQNIPLASYPFTIVHELAHQMGIGFEDECNFIAFRKLVDHPNAWYRYSAYYETIRYLLRPLYKDKLLYKHYLSKLSPLIVSDFEVERDFWKEYRGPIDHMSEWFYRNYLKHNNQPEGIGRYSMMARLVIAWELK